ncbi:hypothetical protein A2Z67_06350 [Candidatus Woesebacteria bacterium RBG_13_36_22]|uniref:Uncharacterized protein n=1 Tax=Candidatus Woesebacteria bacterium RBG_13_36_22 TaxID=1802478 RepID=A0A1F7X1I3_9BACT|nr:MAG: hypothetical protein A2Z67_06350 [Candidatus Woesebacteria bacterium RBG_13_36_22]
MKSVNRNTEKIVDINDLVLQITARGTKPLLHDDIWKCYGFKKTPSHKNIFFRLFRKKCSLENCVISEVLTMGLIDVITGIKKSKESRVNKLLISLGVIDQFISMTKHMIAPDHLLESLLYTYESYLATDKRNLYSLIVYKAKNKLNKKDFAKFLAGTEKLLKLKPNGDFLVKSSKIREIVENSFKENKLNISMSKDEFEKYSSLVKEKILTI